jgi:benzoate/toluate 1,2-dioxygenase alpha subunit
MECEALLRDLGAAIRDERERGRFEVDRRVFSSPQIFELELKRIFEATWIYMAHESQLARPNDFITGTIGRVPVVITRRDTGALAGFVNSCSHRGALVCNQPRGNNQFFSCPYHGWSFDTAGRNVRIKGFEQGAYPASFGSTNHDLTPLPHVASYRGFVFASLNPHVEPLEDFLGEARIFIDMLADQSPDGLEVLPGASTYTYRGNWKMQAENGVDGYHANLVHASYFRLIANRIQSKQGKVVHLSGELLKFKNGCYDLGNGHCMIWSDLPQEGRNRPLYERYEDLKNRFGPLRAKWMVGRMRNLLIFPSVLLMDQASTQIRMIQPLAPDETLIKIYCFAPRGESAAARELRIRQYEDFFNASGMATPDDLACFEDCQEGYRGAFGRYFQPYDRGLAAITLGPDAEAREIGLKPQASGHYIEDEVLYHGLHRRWLQLMTSADDELMEDGRERSSQLRA